MKVFKRVLSLLLCLIMVISIVSVAAEAASVSVTNTNYGYMVPTDSKFTKPVSTVKVYGTHDYLNFYIESEYDNKYFFYEIYSDKEYTNAVAADYVYCDSGECTWSPLVKLKGVFKSGTYYCITFAATIDSSGNIKVSAPSMQEFKLVVDRTTAFSKQVVVLKNVKNTVNGPQISWCKQSNTASKYAIYRRSINGTKWTKVGTVDASKLTFTDTSVKDKNGKYVYTVKALDKKGNGSRYHFGGLTALYAKTPKIESITTLSNNRISFTWENVYDNALYVVYRKTNGGKWEILNKFVYCRTTYTDTKVESGNNYEYTVRARINTNHGAAISSYYSGNSINYVASPELLQPVPVDNGVQVSWKEATGATAYTVYRRPLDKSESWTNLGKVSNDTLTFVDETADTKYGYTYTVRAEAEGCRGSYNSSGIDYFFLKQPEITVIESGDSLKVSWEKIPFAELYYVYYRGPGEEWTECGRTSGCEFSLHKGKCAQIEFSVRANRENEFSEYSEPSESILFFPTVKTYCAVYLDNNRVTWNDAGADYYNLYKKLKAEDDSAYELIYSGTNTYYEDADVEYYEGYTYMVHPVYKTVVGDKKIKAKDITRLKAEDYITSFNTVSIKTYYGEYLKYDTSFTDAAIGMRSSLYYRSQSSDVSGFKGYSSGEIQDLTESYEIQANEFGNKLEDKVFALQVKDDYCATPVDAFTDVIDPVACDKPNVKLNPVANGLKVSWVTDENAKSYQVTISNPKKQHTLEPIEVDGSATCSVVIDKETANCLYDSVSTAIVVRAVATSGNATESIVRDYSYFPESPELLYAYATSNGNRLVWKADVGYNQYDGHRYTIFRKAPGETSWTKLYNYCGDRWGSEYFTDKTAKPGVAYKYTVRIYDLERGVYASYYDTNGITVNTLGTPKLLSAVNSENGAKITWSSNTEAKAYYVYRKTADTSWIKLGSTKEASFIDTTAKSGVDYWYTVRAINDSHKSSYDKVGIKIHYLATPRVQKMELTDDSFKITWDKVDGADGYYLYKKQSTQKSWTRIAYLTENFYEDKDIVVGGAYYYTVKAHSDKGTSAYVSSEDVANIKPPVIKTIENTTDGVKLTWDAVEGASRYNVLRKSPGGDWKVIKGEYKELSFVDTQAKPGVNYSYTLKGYRYWYVNNANISLAYSECDDVGRSIKRLTTPTLTSAKRTSTGVNVKWSEVTGASGYYVYRKTADSGWSRIGNVKSGSTVSFNDKTAEKGTTYYYTVKAYSGSSTSGYVKNGIKCS